MYIYVYIHTCTEVHRIYIYTYIYMYESAYAPVCIYILFAQEHAFIAVGGDVYNFLGVSFGFPRNAPRRSLFLPGAATRKIDCGTKLPADSLQHFQQWRIQHDDF